MRIAAVFLLALATVSAHTPGVPTMRTLHRGVAQGPSPEEQARMNAQNHALRELLKSTPRLPQKAGTLEVQPPTTPGWAMGMVSWVAGGPDGLTYLLQRGESADPVIVVDRNGKIVRSWGKGMYTTPHAIR
ncbi:MAG TPA: hypothetical protein VJ691_09345, partial [Vicinamibacterales bacterium]|nr:hypothetical protein [Vicinamibacterales bacterium]